MEPFDLLRAPLAGRNLIEASAGTGKTYNIEGLFIRLVLELHLEIDQILILTFTKAATEELKTRIRDKVIQARDGFASGGSTDPLINSLVKTYADQNAASERLHQALIDFDQAAIFTIHGFCQRIIHEHAFETHHLFDTELVSNQTHLVREVVDDFWREVFYTAPPEWIAYALGKVKKPDYFVRLLNKVKTRDIKLVPETTKPELASLQPFRDALAELRKAWPPSRDAAIEALMDPALNANMYGRMKPSASHPDMSDRELKVLGLAEAMDHLASGQSTGFPLFDKFENFTATKLTRATKKKHTPPDNQFFDLCDVVYNRSQPLAAEFEQLLIFQKSRLFDYASAELRERKHKINVQHFDDLLLTVLDVLRSKNAGQLVAGIRQRYRAALVDEFQDTDSVQYEILSRFFSDADSLLFMIGDPKQSIYSFRGADIFSYMKAARGTEARFTLLNNWRSEPDLITAVNTIFTSVERPFIYDGIPFEAGKSAGHFAKDERSTGPPLVLWYLSSESVSGDEKPIVKPVATRRIADAVGGEICRLLSASPPYEPAEIAVLVRTNDQARLIKELLAILKVPSVLYTTTNIFDTHEAMEIQRILAAVAHPADNSRIKAALATDILGASAEDLITGDAESQWWESRLNRFGEYLQIWEQAGFIRMFGLFLAREKVKNRLLYFADGERRLTNLLHLTELLHRQSVEGNTGIANLLKWLAEQRDPSTPRLEENQLRLESDENAVRIVTIHKSKGLEYPVVFCPFGWEDSLITDREFAFHDVADDFQLTFDLGSEAREQHLAQARNELLAENLRLLYVALTRAKKRCYLAWGNINRSETSALAYLFHSGADQPITDTWEDQTQILKDHIKNKNDTQKLEDLRQLAARSQNSIKVAALPDRDKSAQYSLKGKEFVAPIFCRRFTEQIDRTWKISSFSSLVSAGVSDVDLPDRDDALASLNSDPPDDTDSREAVDHSNGHSVYDFPRGARAGSFFHDVLEHYDFSANQPELLSELVSDKLQQYGYDARWQETICRAISRVIGVPLQENRSRFTLSSLKAEDRITEMEFYFPLNPITPARIRKAFKHLGRGSRFKEFPGQLGRLTFAPALGFMKGYIDMIFRHKERFYLVDWKSNHLGSGADHYNQDNLQRAMETNYYILQYHIYALALHQYLRNRQSNYSFDNHFGGIFYIFIRGVSEMDGSTTGIFHDRPDVDLINDLGHHLIQGYS